jgi:ribosome recycling factor
MIEAILNKTRDRMRKSIEATMNDLSSIRSGRATPALVENIVIAAYEGTQRMRLMEMATITGQDAKTLLISPFDVSQVQAIERGIQEANVGLNPMVDGESIRITIPSLSEERRKEYIKLANTKIEAGKVMIRQVRHDALKETRRASDDKLITEDDLEKAEKHVQDLTDEMVAELDGARARKEEELMQV